MLNRIDYRLNEFMPDVMNRKIRYKNQGLLNF